MPDMKAGNCLGGRIGRPIHAIAFLVWTPLSHRDYLRFGIDVLRERLNVMVFDCTSWLAPKAILDRGIEIARFPGYVQVDSSASCNSIFEAIQLDSGWAVVDLLGTSIASNSVREKVREYGALRIELSLGVLPQVTYRFRHRLNRFFQNWKKLPAKLAQLANRKILPDIVVLSGEKSVVGYEAVPLKIWAHSLDFDAFLDLKRQIIDPPLAIEKKPYILYLDEDLPCHSDSAQFQVSPVTTPERFFPAINRIFSRIEELHGMPVVIAAHPRSQYHLRANPFQGRAIVVENTMALVSGATAILAHCSTSIGFAILCAKPVMLLTSDDLKRNYITDPLITAFSNYLRTEPINIDRIRNLNNILKVFPTVNLDAYDQYRKHLMKSNGTPDAPLWAIVLNALDAHNRNSKES